ncbi:MAG: hypothetical protein ABSG95_06040 [Solirubrobacteraceae bacterium]|jgi:hypothetical protein
MEVLLAEDKARYEARRLAELETIRLDELMVRDEHEDEDEGEEGDDQ